MKSRIKEYVREWLGIKDVVEFDLEWKQNIDNKISTLDRQQDNILSGQHSLKKAFEYTCDNCGLTFMRWPFGGGYYREHDGSLLHSKECLEDWISKDKDE